jgi:hypothetical protein
MVATSANCYADHNIAPSPDFLLIIFSMFIFVLSSLLYKCVLYVKCVITVWSYQIVNKHCCRFQLKKRIQVANIESE